MQQSCGGPAGYAWDREKLRLGLALLSILAAPLAVAQPSGVDGLVADREAAERAHAWRIAGWGASSVAAGTVLFLLSTSEDTPGPRAFGLQTAGWGVINAGIAAVALTGRGAPAVAWGEAVRAEDHLGNVLLVNLGLDVGYVLVGATLLAVAGRGVARPAAWRGHGAALVVQGLVLVGLDAVLYAGSSRRLGALIDAVPTASLGVTPSGLTLTLPF